MVFRPASVLPIALNCSSEVVPPSGDRKSAISLRQKPRRRPPSAVHPAPRDGTQGQPRIHGSSVQNASPGQPSLWRRAGLVGKFVDQPSGGFAEALGFDAAYRMKPPKIGYRTKAVDEAAQWTPSGIPCLDFQEGQRQGSAAATHDPARVILPEESFGVSYRLFR